MATHEDPKDKDDHENRPADSGSDSVDDTASSMRNPESGCFTGPTLQRLGQGDKFYEIIKNSFVTGIKHLGKNTDVVGICRKIYDVDDIAKARSRAFSAAVGDKNDRDPNINLGGMSVPAMRFQRFCLLDLVEADSELRLWLMSMEFI